MSLWYTTFLVVLALLVAGTTTKRGLHASLFCVLFVCVMVIWLAVSASVQTWFQHYGVSSTLAQYKTVVLVSYMTGFFLNLLLLHYLNTYTTGYKLIFFPIAFYALLSIFVPLEQLLFDTESMYRLYNYSPETINTIEVFLLAADRNEYRRHGKRFITRMYTPVHTLATNTVFGRIR